MFRISTLVACLCVIISSQTNCINQLVLFHTFIVGNFDNKKQVEQEINEYGHQIHPYAQHISDMLNQKIINLPSNITGFFVLEESYYTYGYGQNISNTTASPFIFYFDSIGQDGMVEITSYDAVGIPQTELKNNNTDLEIYYHQLVQNRFKPSVYQYNKSDNSFYLINSTTIYPNGDLFTLTEIIAQYQLNVLEGFWINGTNVVGYNTSIIYDRL